MQESRTSPVSHAPRRLILGAALAFGLIATLVPHEPGVRAAGSAIVVVQADAQPQTAPAQSGPNAAPVPPVPPIPAVPTPPGTDTDGADADAASPGATSTITVDKNGIVIEKGRKRVHVGGLGRDREYDSFQQFVQDAPWLAGLVFLSVLLVFLVPLLIIVLVIWYKIRKNRMANETMLKLAERGVLPPTTAMDAVASGNAVSMAAAATAVPPSAPAYEHARALQRRAVWSDLRRGVILSGAGLGLSLWSMMDDGAPNSVGLILLFVGVGYCLLWYLEDRPRPPSSGG